VDQPAPEQLQRELLDRDRRTTVMEQAVTEQTAPFSTSCLHRSTSRWNRRSARGWGQQDPKARRPIAIGHCSRNRSRGVSGASGGGRCRPRSHTAQSSSSSESSRVTADFAPVWTRSGTPPSSSALHLVARAVKAGSLGRRRSRVRATIASPRRRPPRGHRQDAARSGARRRCRASRWQCRSITALRMTTNEPPVSRRLARGGYAPAAQTLGIGLGLNGAYMMSAGSANARSVQVADLVERDLADLRGRSAGRVLSWPHVQ